MSGTNIPPAIGGRNLRISFTVILVIGWLVVIGVAEWSYAVAETEPPGFDALSYAVKAFYFWDAISHGRFFNPLDLPPSVRPPGTVLMSYPFGFSTSFAGFYFRSTFIPLFLLIGAIYIVGYFRDMPDAAKWLLAVLAIAIGGMPILFQFQGEDDIPTAIVTWGLVDNFLAGFAAISIASARRSVSTLSHRWAIASAFGAAFCLMIKPSGLLVMVLVAATWLLLISFRVNWNLFRLWREPVLRRFCVISLSAAIIIYGVTGAAAFTSQYLGATNLAWGDAALAVLQKDFAVPIQLDTLLLQVRISLGYPLVLLMGLGLIAGLTIRGEIGATAGAFLCLSAGIWFWLFATGISMVRYFVPFGVMTFIVVVPSLLRVMQCLPAWLRIVSAGAIVTPTAVITILILIPQPPAIWQRSFGINLSSGVYRAEDEQAVELLNNLQRERQQSASVYSLELGAPARNFEAVISFRTFVDSLLPRISFHRPLSWETATTFRLNEIAAVDYAVFVPIHDDAQLRSILETRSAPDLGTETLLMKAWFSSLNAADGVEIVSETRLRLLRIADRMRFQESLENLRAAHDWRAEFRAANGKP